MKQRFYSLSLQKLFRQRDRLFFLACLLGVSNLFLGIKTFLSSERVVIVPASLSKSFWVDPSQVSSEYLEEMALFFARQILDISPASAPYQRDVVLRYTSPSFHNALKKRLLEEETRARENQVSTSFKPVSVKVHPKVLEVEMTGDLIAYVGGKTSHQTRETYLMTFSYTQGRLLVTRFVLKKEGDAHAS